ncbi:MAG: NEW3 domain-containing protein, partial [Candidatus Hydrothermarchaeales archaeon]
GDTGINLTAKVTNLGNESATDVWLAWILPNGWTNTSGNLNKSNFTLDAGKPSSNTITVSISSSAPTGTQTLQANASCAEDKNGTASVSVTVSSAAAPPSAPPVAGAGPRRVVEEKIVEVPVVTIEVAPPSYSPTPGEKEQLFQSIETLELVRGFEYTFIVKITNPFPNATLENVTLKMPDPFSNLTLENVSRVGSSSEYIEISPELLTDIEYGETEEFVVKVTAPTFVKKGIYPLNSTLAGKALYYDYPVNISNATGEVLSRKNISTDMMETKTINLIVYSEVSPTYSPTPGERAQLFQSIEMLELVRGFDDTFSIKVTNPFPNSILQDVDLSVTGLLAQYLDVSPRSYPEIGYGETEEFKVRVSTPTYLEKGTYPLSTALTGRVFYPDYPTAISDITGKVLSSKSFTLDMVETKTINLIVHAIPKEEALSTLKRAESGIADMESAGFSTSRALKFSKEAKEALEQGDYQRAKELGQEIVNIKETAFTTSALIQDLKGKIEDAENRGLKVIETKELLYLASAAFEREDYETAQRKIKDAQVLYSLETKGKVNYIKIILDYWYLALLTILITSIAGAISYQKISLLRIDRRLRGLGVEEINIANLIREARIKYYAEKTITSAMYRETIDEYEKRLVEIRRTRARLRARRRGMMKLPDRLESLKKENQSLAELIKDAQDAYYNKRIMNREEYLKSIEQYKKRKAEVEEKIAMLETKLAKEKRVKTR